MLQRLADEEMLHEVHAGTAVHAGQFEAAVALETVVALPMSRDARARGITERLGIRVAARDVLVLVAVVALDETRGLLVQHGARGAQPQLAAAHFTVGQ